MLVELSQLQDTEVGDGTTSVVIIAAELLKRANELVKEKVHPTSVIAGFRQALKESIRYMKDNLVVKVDDLGQEALLQVAKTSMSSKLVSAEADYFADIVVKAVQATKIVTSNQETKYPIKAVRILKCHGQSLRETMFFPGYCLNLGRASQGMPMKITNARIACLDFNLNKYKCGWGVSV